MNNKTIITIVLAAILALISAFLILNKITSEKVLEEVNTSQPKRVVAEEVLNENEENAELEDIKQEEVKKNEATVTSLNKTAKKTANVPSIDDKVVVQEGSVVEEVEQDYGIRKVGDTVEVTREFRIKSPIKYSFKDFGILYNVEVK